jgi:alkylmercury lyase
MSQRRENMDPSIIAILENHLQEALYCSHPSLWLFVVRALAKGKPVTQMGIVAEFGMSFEEVRAVLAMFKDIEYDDNGHLVSCGISLIPTPHSFKVNGETLFTWCALDALMYPMALQQTAQVESRCPVTSLAVRLTVTPTGISFLDPVGAAVSIVIPQETQAGCCNIRNAFCSEVHFMSSREAADMWRLKHPEVTVISVEEAWCLGRAIMQRRLACEP